MLYFTGYSLLYYFTTIELLVVHASQVMYVPWLTLCVTMTILTRALHTTILFPAVSKCATPLKHGGLYASQVMYVPWSTLCVA